MYGNSLYYICNFSVSPEAVKIKCEKENLQVRSVTAANIGTIHKERGMLPQCFLCQSASERMPCCCMYLREFLFFVLQFQGHKGPLDLLFQYELITCLSNAYLIVNFTYQRATKNWCSANISFIVPIPLLIFSRSPLLCMERPCI